MAMFFSGQTLSPFQYVFFVESLLPIYKSYRVLSLSKTDWHDPWPWHWFGEENLQFSRQHSCQNPEVVSLFMKMNVCSRFLPLKMAIKQWKCIWPIALQKNHLMFHFSLLKFESWSDANHFFYRNNTAVDKCIYHSKIFKS